ncbi:hypothetical protein LLH23_09575 [bacterium]|nr:hypothetical protein [bacterium]
MLLGPSRAIGLAIVMAVGLTAVAHGDTINQYGGPLGAWPTIWLPLNGLNDPDDGQAEQLDFVGDATNPGGYWAFDQTYVYFRMRVDTGTVISGTYHDTLMVLIDVAGEGVTGRPDYAFAWDTKSADLNQHGLEMQRLNTTNLQWSGTKMEDLDGQVGLKISPPDFSLTGGDGYLRTVDGQLTTNFGTTTYVDWAISWSYLTANTTLAMGQTWQIQFGSIANATDHNFITTDVAGNHNPSDAGLTWGETAATPEPGSLCLVGLGLGCLEALRRRRARNNRT